MPCLDVLVFHPDYNHPFFTFSSDFVSSDFVLLKGARNVGVVVFPTSREPSNAAVRFQ